jgi:hypothetical protein
MNDLAVIEPEHVSITLNCSEDVIAITARRHRRTHIVEPLINGSRRSAR